MNCGLKMNLDDYEVIKLIDYDLNYSVLNNVNQYGSEGHIFGQLDDILNWLDQIEDGHNYFDHIYVVKE